MRCGSRSREGEEKIEHIEGMEDTFWGHSQQDKLMSSVLKEERNDSFHLCSSKDTWGNMGGAIEPYPGVRCGLTLIATPTSLRFPPPPPTQDSVVLS